MVEEEKTPVGEQPVDEETVITEEKVEPTEPVEKDDEDADITEILEKIQEIVHELADLVSQATQLQANDEDIMESIEESIKGVVQDELAKGMKVFKEEIIKAVKEIVSVGIPPAYNELKSSDKVKAMTGAEEVKVSEDALKKLEPEIYKGNVGVRSGVMSVTEDPVEARLKVVEKIMKGEITDIRQARKFLMR